MPKSNTVRITLTPRLAREVADWISRPPVPPTVVHGANCELERVQRLAEQFRKAAMRKRRGQSFDLCLTRSDARRLITLACGLPFSSWFGWKYDHRPDTPDAVRYIADLCIVAVTAIKHRGNPNFKKRNKEQINASIMKAIEDRTYRAGYRDLAKAKALARFIRGGEMTLLGKYPKTPE